MSAEALLERIEQQGLLKDNVIASLRKQVAESGVRITPETIVQMLVDKNLLTTFQGKKLLSDIAAETVMLQEDELELAPSESEEEFDVAPSNSQAKKPASSRPAPLPTKPNKKKEKWKTSGPKVRTESAEAAPAQGGSEPADAGELIPLDDASGLTPLESLNPDPLGVDPLGVDPLMMEQPSQQAQAPRQRKPRKNPWESALMFVGVGVLVVMVLVGVLLYVSLTSAPATEVFEQAETSYKEGQYLQAVERYQQFLDDYPDDENVSRARVRQGLARLRHVVRDARDWKLPLTTAQKELPNIETEPSFPGARDELAAMLPQIAEGFATQAQQASDFDKAAGYVEQAEAAMKLVNNPVYIPPSLRRSPGTEARIEEILTTIATVRRELSREQELVDTVKAIEEAADAGETTKAYALRDALLKTYPGLESNNDLQAAVRAISRKQRELVKLSRGGPQALTDERFVSPDFQIVLAGHAGETADEARGRLAVVQAEGALYGLDAATGEVKWRRFIGYDPAPPAVRIAGESSEDVLVVDPRGHELLRLEGSTGRLLWRLPLDNPLSTPVATENAVVVADVTGKIYSLEPETGNCLYQAVLPQPASLAPAVDPATSMCYVVADHTNVYALSLPDLECRDVCYLGHKPGTVSASPLALRGHLLIAENTSAKDSRIRAISTGPAGATLAELRTDFPVQGRVAANPVSQSSRVLFLSDLGAIHVFEVDPTNKRAPVSEDDIQPATESQSTVFFPTVYQGQLFVGGTRLTKYEIQTSRGQLTRKWPIYEGDTFVGPVQVFGNVLISVRRRKGALGLTAAACETSDGAEIWRTSLGAPLAGEAYADTKRRQLVVLSSAGQLFEIDQASINAGFLGNPSADLDAKQQEGMALDARFDLGGGRLAFASQPPDTRIAYYDPQAKERLTLSTPRVPGGSLCCRPVLFQNGLLMPCDDGRIYLIDPATGAALVKPFQPPLSAGERVQWRRPALLADGQRFVTADNRNKLYLVELKQSPEPHLAEIASAEVPQEVASGPAVAGESVVAVRREGNKDMLQAFASDLSTTAETPVKGRIVWGPYAAGDAALAATDRGQLHCIGADGQSRWSVSVGKGRLTGAPLMIDGEVALASTSGDVTRINLDDGRQTADLNLGEPLGAAPVPFLGKLLLTGSDGTVYIASWAEAPAS